MASSSTIIKFNNNSPKHIREIETFVFSRMKTVIKSSCKLLESQQLHSDQITEIYRKAFNAIIEKTITCSKLLNEIKIAYENSLTIRDERITKFIIQDKAFGISGKKLERDDKMKTILKENEDLRETNQSLLFEIEKLKKNLGEIKDEKFSEYLNLMRERDARYTLYHENLELNKKLKELDGSSVSPNDYGDPVVLRIALDRCR